MAFNPFLHAESIEDEIDGILLDHTITIFGYRLCRELGNYRRIHSSHPDANITVYEKPSARWGSLIRIEIDGQVVFRQFISPTRNQTDRLAAQISSHIDTELTRRKLQQLLTTNLDIDGDEL